MLTIAQDKERQFIEAYDALASDIFRYCYRKISDRETAKDLMQQSFTKTWDYLAKGGVIESFKPFLYRVADNVITDQYRKRKSVSLEVLKENGWEPRLDDKESVSLMIDAHDAAHLVSQLSETYKEVITMRYTRNLRIREIAQIREETENAVSIRIHRGLKKMQEMAGQKGWSNYAQISHTHEKGEKRPPQAAGKKEHPQIASALHKRK